MPEKHIVVHLYRKREEKEEREKKRKDRPHFYIYIYINILIHIYIKFHYFGHFTPFFQSHLKCRNHPPFAPCSNRTLSSFQQEAVWLRTKWEVPELSFSTRIKD